MIQRGTGFWTLNLLLITLAISPLRAITELHWLLRLRRMLGLFTYFYATLHFLNFVGLQHSFSANPIANDILERPFVTVGFAAFLLLTPLAATSNQWAIRKLGGRKWQELHRSIYLISILACIHFFWATKATAIAWPLAYSLALIILLAWRVQERRRKAILTPLQNTAKPLKFFKNKPD